MIRNVFVMGKSLRKSPSMVYDVTVNRDVVEFYIRDMLHCACGMCGNPASNKLMTPSYDKRSYGKRASTLCKTFGNGVIKVGPTSSKRLAIVR